MSASSITMMVVGMVILWGGLAASILNVVRVSKKASKNSL
ncbi:methionine/alanine import family NSS transporter small subunit [Neobacillus niacini]|nr:methionine/alanine import family NSS transporter small subunit [Neobacillus niacini]MCM3693499.1 methionine/alanine import family NSS transporter small subunit [Neobacillus niacini]